MADFLIGADFNCPPTNRDKYRPLWIASSARLKIRDAGPGRFGNIDFCLTNADMIAGPKRKDNYGSDHDLIIWVTTGLQFLRGGTWNVLAGRDPLEVAKEVKFIMEHFQLDYLLLQEVSIEVERAIREIGHYKVLGQFNPIVVRKDLITEETEVWQLSDAGWPVSGNRYHAPVMGSTTLIEGILRVVSVHFPNYERSPMHAKAYKQAAKRLVRRANKDHRRG